METSQLPLLACLPGVADVHTFRDALFEVPHEDVVVPVRVARHQVGGVRLEGHDPAVAAERAVPRVVVGLLALLAHADPLDGARLHVADEDVALLVRVTGDEGPGVGAEGHIAAVGAHSASAAASDGLPVRADAHEHGGPGLPVAKEHVACAVGIAWGQIACVRLEDHPAARRADDGQVALASRPGPIARHADQLRDAGLPVEDEYVRSVTIAGDHVGRVRLIGHVPAVVADGGPAGGAVRIPAVHVPADLDDDVGLPGFGVQPRLRGPGRDERTRGAGPARTHRSGRKSPSSTPTSPPPA